MRFNHLESQNVSVVLNSQTLLHSAVDMGLTGRHYTSFKTYLDILRLILIQVDQYGVSMYYLIMVDCFPT